MPGTGGDDGPATAALVNTPRGVFALDDGGFLISDSNNHRVRLVAPNGTIATVAGTGSQGFRGDGASGTSAQLSIPFGVAPMPDGGFLIADVGNQRIRPVFGGGTIATVVGTGTAGLSGDGGPATAAAINSPHNVAVTADSAFLIADTSNQRFRRVTADGTISTFAGIGTGLGTGSYSGDGGPATSAGLNAPKAVANDGAGAVLIADDSNNRIRFVRTPVAPANIGPPNHLGQRCQRGDFDVWQMVGDGTRCCLPVAALRRQRARLMWFWATKRWRLPTIPRVHADPGGNRGPVVTRRAAPSRRPPVARPSTGRGSWCRCSAPALGAIPTGSDRQITVERSRDSPDAA